MRITLTLSSSQSIVVPLGYNHIIQSFIYHHIPPALADFLHERGYCYEKRSFKLFTFSNLAGTYKLMPDGFHFQSPVKLTICSPVDDFLSQFAQCILKQELQFLKQPIIVDSIEIHTDRLTSDTREIQIKMLSPVTIYSTLMNHDTRKTWYYSPMEDDFSTHIANNLQRKYKALYPDSDTAAFDFAIAPLGIKKHHEKIITYKGTVIKGWMGQYRLTGAADYLRFALNAGIGSKNSQGFGCCEWVKVSRPALQLPQ